MNSLNGRVTIRREQVQGHTVYVDGDPTGTLMRVGYRNWVFVPNSGSPLSRFEAPNLDKARLKIMAAPERKGK